MINDKTISLVCIDCANYELALMAMDHCIEHTNFFDEALFLSDEVSEFKQIRHLSSIQQITIPKINSKQEYSQFVLSKLSEYIETDYIVLIQWDGYITHADLWTNDFLNYDYIGARWWNSPDGQNIGNGGFSLRSKNFLNACKIMSLMVTDQKITENRAEDIVIGTIWRPILEQHFNMKFATNEVADRFSHEGWFEFKEAFGFHGIADMWRYLMNKHHENLYFNYLESKNPLNPEELKIIIKRSSKYYSKK